MSRLSTNTATMWVSVAFLVVCGLAPATEARPRDVGQALARAIPGRALVVAAEEGRRILQRKLLNALESWCYEHREELGRKEHVGSGTAEGDDTGASGKHIGRALPTADEGAQPAQHAARPSEWRLDLSRVAAGSLIEPSVANGWDAPRWQGLQYLAERPLARLGESASVSGMVSTTWGTFNEELRMARPPTGGMAGLKLRFDRFEIFAGATSSVGGPGFLVGVSFSF